MYRISSINSGTNHACIRPCIVRIALNWFRLSHEQTATRSNWKDIQHVLIQSPQLNLIDFLFTFCHSLNLHSVLVRKSLRAEMNRNWVSWTRKVHTRDHQTLKAPIKQFTGLNGFGRDINDESCMKPPLIVSRINERNSTFRRRWHEKKENNTRACCERQFRSQVHRQSSWSKIITKHVFGCLMSYETLYESIIFNCKLLHEYDCLFPSTTMTSLLCALNVSAVWKPNYSITPLMEQPKKN